MSLHSAPILYLNMGGEMLYVLRQRLTKLKKIDVDKTIQVLDNITSNLLNSKILSSMFEKSSMVDMLQLRHILEGVALSTIVKLDKNSMDKLFDLMIMMVKYQLTVATGPREVLLITLNHIDAMRAMVSDVNAQECVSLVHQMVVDYYGCLICEEVWLTRQCCLKILEPYNVRLSILLRYGLQNADASFNKTYPHGYDEKYTEKKSILANIRLKDVSPETSCDGSFDVFGDRKTLLGKNIYLPTYGIMENTRRDSQQFLRDSGKGELGMLAVQLGTEEANYERPFTLNLLSNADEDNANNVKSEIKIEGDVRRNNEESRKPKLNEDYKAKLDNVYADFFEDESEQLKRSMNLLDLLDEIE